MIAKRVLVVDDSALIRKMVSDSLSGRPDIEGATAPNGMIALEKAPRFDPDLVILDVEMPGLSGLETLDRLLKINPRLRVIMFSAATEAGAGISMDALARGAADCLAKPSSAGGGIVGLDFLRAELVPRVEGLLGLSSKPGQVGGARSPAASPMPRETGTPAPRVSPPRSAAALPAAFDILAIASSTGGPTALQTLFEALPGDLPVPIVLVQHMPPVFTKTLAERLTAKSRIQVKEAAHGERLLAGCCYLAPGNFHLEVVRSLVAATAAIHQGPPENSCRPAADVLFRSVAAGFKGRALGIVLTGMGQDGMLGCRDLKQAGGWVIAQDEATSVVWGMPGSVVKAGLADEVAPLGQIAAKIVKLMPPRK